MSESVEPTYSEADLEYVRSEYLSLDQLCEGRAETADGVRRLIEQGRLPGPAYVLPEGTEMFPPNYFELPDSAGDLGRLHDHFVERHQTATTALGVPGVDPGEDWEGYLSGQFGVCLHEVTPEAMVEKSALIAEIDRLTAVPATEDDGWRASLTKAVDELDEIERPFTDYDRQRWGGTSRDSHITTVRAKYLDG